LTCIKTNFVLSILNSTDKVWFQLVSLYMKIHHKNSMMSHELLPCYQVEWVNDWCLMPTQQFSAISWQEQVREIKTQIVKYLENQWSWTINNSPFHSKSFVVKQQSLTHSLHNIMACQHWQKCVIHLKFGVSPPEGRQKNISELLFKFYYEMVNCLLFMIIGFQDTLLSVFWFL
jgi:hypothetical protein